MLTWLSGIATISAVNMRFGRSLIFGALIGLVTGIVALLILAPIMINNVDARLLGDGTARVETFFSIGSASLELPHLVDMGETTLFTGTVEISPLGLVSVFAALGFGFAGLVTSAALQWMPRAFDPDAVVPRNSGKVLTSGALTGAITGLLFAQGAVIWLGEQATTTAEIPIVPGLLWALLAGVSIGSAVAGLSHLLSRPDVIGLDELGWETPEEFKRATARAVGVPVMAMVVVLVVVAAFGALFLGISPDVVPHGGEEASGDVNKAPLLIIASLISAVILGFAAFAAYRPRAATKRRESR